MIAPSTMQAFMEWLESTIKRGKSTSVVRLGDGEWDIIKWPTHQTREVALERISRWFDVSQVTDVDMKAIRQTIMLACIDADALGIPSIYEQMHWPKWKGFAEMVISHGIHHSGQLTWHFYEIAAMYDDGFFDRILTGRDHLGIITCRDVRGGLREKYKIKKVDLLRIPQERFEYKHSLAHLDVKGDKAHWPDRCEEISAWIKTHDMRGQLWLIGAGGLGKHYAYLIKSAGGIAFDVGALFDGWAGIETRPYLANPGKFKL